MFLAAQESAILNLKKLCKYFFSNVNMFNYLNYKRA